MIGWGDSIGWSFAISAAGHGEAPPSKTTIWRGVTGADADAVGAAVTDTGVVPAQDDVAAKTNEITGFAPLLDRLRVAGRTVTADALHTQRGHAEYLHGRDAEFVFCVKGNQPRLFDALDVLPWT